MSFGVGSATSATAAGASGAAGSASAGVAASGAAGSPALVVRRGEVVRRTGETDVRAVLTIDGGGAGMIDTGIAFFDHMLMQTVKHGGFDLTLKATGDLEVDAHHTMEDCGIVLGETLAQALGDKAGVRRFSHAYAPLDESLARVVVDLSGRAGLCYQVLLSRTQVGGADADLFREFFQALARAAKITLHVDLLRGVNAHHQMEAVFKAFGIALAAACERRGGGGGAGGSAAAAIPSTKGVL